MTEAPTTINYTRHARRRMKWRKISKQDIENALASPDRVECMKSNQYNAYTRIQGRLLKVVYRKEDDVAEIVTALWKGE